MDRPATIRRGGQHAHAKLHGEDQGRRVGPERRLSAVRLLHQRRRQLVRTLPGGLHGTSGTTATQTVTAYAVPFNQASTTLNRVRFHISDVAGNSTTSSPLTVQITATPDGLPANGDFELGTVGGLPSLWQSQTTTSGPGTGTSSFTCQLISSARFHGLQSVQGRAYRNPDVTTFNWARTPRSS